MLQWESVRKWIISNSEVISWTVQSDILGFPHKIHLDSHGKNLFMKSFELDTPGTQDKISERGIDMISNFEFIRAQSIKKVSLVALEFFNKRTLWELDNNLEGRNISINISVPSFAKKFKNLVVEIEWAEKIFQPVMLYTVFQFTEGKRGLPTLESVMSLSQEFEGIDETLQYEEGNVIKDGTILADGKIYKENDYNSTKKVATGIMDIMVEGTISKMPWQLTIWGINGNSYFRCTEDLWKKIKPWLELQELIYTSNPLLSSDEDDINKMKTLKITAEEECKVSLREEIQALDIS